MQPVLLAVGEVVHDIHRRGEQAEGGERGQRHRHLGGVVPGVAEQQADEDEAVLDPLVRPQQFDQWVHAMSGKYLSQKEQPFCGNQAGNA